MSVKTKQLEELRTKTEGELHALLKESRSELALLRMKLRVNQESKTHKVGLLKTKIARIQALLHAMVS